MEAGRYTTFRSSEESRRYLRGITDEAIAETKLAAE
jgi:hypothetical protein